MTRLTVFQAESAAEDAEQRALAAEQRSAQLEAMLRRAGSLRAGAAAKVCQMWLSSFANRMAIECKAKQLTGVKFVHLAKLSALTATSWVYK